jgi:hypothetical protein
MARSSSSGTPSAAEMVAMCDLDGAGTVAARLGSPAGRPRNKRFRPGGRRP